MSYKNMLVAVDFNQGTAELVNKAVSLAKSLNAEVSLVHVNHRETDGEIFNGLIDMELSGVEPAHPMSAELNEKLDELVNNIDHPIAHRYVINGNLTYDVKDLVKEVNVDLVMCGHHHNFWSRLKPSAGGLINVSPVDLLIVSLDG